MEEKMKICLRLDTLSLEFGDLEILCRQTIYFIYLLIHV